MRVRPAVLVLDPAAEVVAAVEDAAAESEAVRADVEVPPVAEGGDGGAEEVGGFGDREQFGLVVGGGSGMAGSGCGRG
jgi:hypothetical protein